MCGYYNPNMENGAFVSHTGLGTVYKTRSSFQLYNQLIILLCFFIIIKNAKQIDT